MSKAVSLPLAVIFCVVFSVDSFSGAAWTTTHQHAWHS
jgi:hypothetical protein